MTGETEIHCQDCDGKGELFEAEDTSRGPFCPAPVTKACPRCKGTGYITVPPGTLP
jgi:DnaJ-class molecular chaperone